ncbi:zinc-binding dehydrogenase [Xylariaceae sp. FL0662B]|nr:zinc-binding dehydrogenase [Xylariaceae sp. FL0662B]
MPRRLPLSQRAIQQDSDGRAHVVSEAAMPPLPPGYALVKTSAVALNHSDHKIMNNWPIPGAYIGTDFCGTVVQTAEDVTSVNIDARVCGAAFCFTPVHRMVNGAFSEYVRAPADLLLRVPSSSEDSVAMAPIQVATLATAIWTCLLALWSTDALGLPGTPGTPQRAEKPIPVLVYGGSTATGTIAMQLLKLSGYDPIATCSPKNFDLVRGRGASAVFDYAAPDVAEKIQAHTGRRLQYVLDCISDVASVEACYGAIQRPGGRYVSLERVPEELLARRQAVHATFVLAAEICGEEIRLGQDGYDRPGSREKLEFALRHKDMFQRLLDLGKLKAHPIEVLEGGLHGVVRGLEVLANEGVSGKKLVAVMQ